MPLMSIIKGFYWRSNPPTYMAYHVEFFHMGYVSKIATRVSEFFLMQDILLNIPSRGFPIGGQKASQTILWSLSHSNFP